MTIELRCTERCYPGRLGKPAVIHCYNEKGHCSQMKAAPNPDKKIIIDDDCLQDDSRELKMKLLRLSPASIYEVNQGEGNHMTLPSPNRLMVLNRLMVFHGYP
jgi:hypothetical protein